MVFCNFIRCGAMLFYMGCAKVVGFPAGVGLCGFKCVSCGSVWLACFLESHLIWFYVGLNGFPLCVWLACFMEFPKGVRLRRWNLQRL